MNDPVSFKSPESITCSASQKDSSSFHARTNTVEKEDFDVDEKSSTSTQATQESSNEKTKVLYKEASHSFSVDLLEQSQRHINFLLEAHLAGVANPNLDAAVLRESIRRYLDLWLPLVYENAKFAGKQGKDGVLFVELVPPVDVAWMWHCHRLAPCLYRKFVEERFRLGMDKVIVERRNLEKKEITEAALRLFLEPTFPFALQRPDSDDPHDTTENCMPTRKLWKRLFPEEPFFLSPKTFLAPKAMRENVSSNSNLKQYLYGFDLMASCKRQASFLWQVLRPQFGDPAFLQDAVVNYHRFLCLIRDTDEKPPEKSRNAPRRRRHVIVPTYQIDLMWHTHILSSIHHYDADCLSISGSNLHHDDSLTDRSEGSSLDVGFRSTQNLWRERYGVEYKVKGGMYRGEPPADFFESSFWAEAMGPVPTMRCTMEMLRSRLRDAVLRPTGTFLHLVGIVGASSSLLAPGDAFEEDNLGGEGSTREYDPAPDDDVDGLRQWRNVEHEEAFLAPNLKSTKLLRNNNPRRHGYVFGLGPLGYGYYDLRTREGYRILAARLGRKARGPSDRERIDMSWIPTMALLFTSFMCAYFGKPYVGLVLVLLACTCAAFICLWMTRSAREAAKMFDVAAARSEAPARFGLLPQGIADEVTTMRHNNFCYEDGSWILPATWLKAASCGAISGAHAGTPDGAFRVGGGDEDMTNSDGNSAGVLYASCGGAGCGMAGLSSLFKKGGDGDGETEMGVRDPPVHSSSRSIDEAYGEDGMAESEYGNSVISDSRDSGYNSAGVQKGEYR